MSSGRSRRGASGARMAEVRWHRAAGQILQSVPATIADRILQATRLLGTFPAMGMRVQDPDWPHVRRVLVREWSVVYAYDSVADVVTVIALIAPGTGHGVQ